MKINLSIKYTRILTQTIINTLLAGYPTVKQFPLAFNNSISQYWKAIEISNIIYKSTIGH